jgi:hypothetical protein
LRDISGLSRVSLVGLRLGASLALQACAGELAADSIVLWEPVVSGRTYVEELREFHHRKAARSLFPASEGLNGADPELLGFPFPAPMREGIEAIELRTGPLCAAERVHLMISEQRADYLELRERYTASCRLDYLFIPEAADRGRDQLEAAMLSQVMLQAIAGALARKS